MDTCVINRIPHHNDAHSLIANSSIVIQTVWSDQSVDITLYSTHNKRGFGGTLLKKSLESTANALELNVDNFLTESKEALCTPNGLADFTYILSNDGTKFKFCKLSEGFRITYGEVNVNQRVDAVDEMLLNSIKLSETKDRNADALRADIRRMDESFNEMKLALAKCVEEKATMEMSLLTKFSALLNAKKDKIVELEAAIKCRPSTVADDFESDGSGDSDPDYCSQTFVREKGPEPSTSGLDATIIPKRPKSKLNETTVQEPVVETKPTSNDESMDVYDQETQLLLDDM